ncbi:MAG: hypothetical protein LBI03_07500 [Clostridiales bacterium]|jgi:hypothetical protein|nr:hypothetical protein [Clostridiales bacterium]
MDVLQSAISEYEDLLIGNRSSMSTYYFSYNENGNMRLALQIMKYAFDTYLHWPPDQLRDCLTMEVIDRLRLSSIIKYIIFPVELDNTKDLFYIAWKLYPGTVHFSEKDLILRVYKNLLEKKIQKYPKEFFDGRYGSIRAQVCLRFLIEQFLPFSSIEELYKYFSTQKCVKVLRIYKLIAACRDLFDTPVEYLHKSLPKEQQNQFLYRYYDFVLRIDEQKSQADQVPVEVTGGGSK